MGSIGWSATEDLARSIFGVDFTGADLEEFLLREHDHSVIELLEAYTSALLARTEVCSETGDIGFTDGTSESEFLASKEVLECSR